MRVVEIDSVSNLSGCRNHLRETLGLRKFMNGWKEGTLRGRRCFSNVRSSYLALHTRPFLTAAYDDNLRATQDALNQRKLVSNHL